MVSTKAAEFKEEKKEEPRVPEENNIARKGQPLYKRILLSIDKSGYKDKVTTSGVRLAKALGSDITIIHVIEQMADEAYQKDYEDALKKQAEKLLAEAQLLGEQEGIRVVTEIVSHVHSVAEGIIDYAKKKNIDLILVGTKGISGHEKFLLGSIASIVISYAHCPVLAVR